MLSIHVTNEQQDRRVEHGNGPIELGRAPRSGVPRLVIEDSYVSRDHLRIEEMPGSRALLTNLSQRVGLDLPDGTNLSPGARRILLLPLRLTLGNTNVELEVMPEEPFEEAKFQSLCRPPLLKAPSGSQTRLGDLGDAAALSQITEWLETVIALQRAPADAKEFYDQTARAVVELVGLDVGLVLIRQEERWELCGVHALNKLADSGYSRTLLQHVVNEGRTFYQDLNAAQTGAPQLQSDSLMEVAAVVASPIFGLSEDVVGALYGSRRCGMGRGGIRQLEAQLVQLLASAVGANLARTTATRTRVQFEQFFSPELVRELERDPNLLEGCNREVTILASDLRGFTRLSERLEPETSCRIVRDIMECLTERIVGQGGAVVDYAGDGILAMWNAPLPQEDHIARACRAAVAMLGELPGLNERWGAVTGAPLALGIGVHTGVARVGNTGCSRKMKYGPHGLTVNFASRIQSATKQVGVPLVISEAVRAQLPMEFTARPVGLTALSGITGEVPLYELRPKEQESSPSASESRTATRTFPTANSR